MAANMNTVDSLYKELTTWAVEYKKIDPSYSFDDKLESEGFICPITTFLIREAVVAADGFTYEREAIEEWLAIKDISPKTLLPLSTKNLYPNHDFNGRLIERLELEVKFLKSKLSEMRQPSNLESSRVMVAPDNDLPPSATHSLGFFPAGSSTGSSPVSHVPSVLSSSSSSSAHEQRATALVPLTEQERYKALIKWQSDLQFLLKELQLLNVDAKYNKLENNIRLLYKEISDEIDDYKVRYLGIEALDPLVSYSPPFFPATAANGLLADLMRTLGTQMRSQLGNNDPQSHLFTAEYVWQLSSHTFESKPFSPCNFQDPPVSAFPAFLRAEKIDISRLQAELDMIGIPGKVSYTKTHYFKHGELNVSAVRVTFDCDNERVFTIAKKLQEIQYGYNPSSVIPEKQVEPVISAPQSSSSMPGFSHSR